MDTGEILIYQNQEGNIKIDVRLEERKIGNTDFSTKPVNFSIVS
jgi:hypothetical protein